MNEYTHVILDEVHERGQEMDFLLLVVKKLLYTMSPAVKVVLMSATFNSKAFADYFMIPTPRGLQMSTCIKVEKREHMFTVKTFYLNHLNKFGSVSFIWLKCNVTKIDKFTFLNYRNVEAQKLKEIRITNNSNSFFLICR